jgi:hypothetical protein
MRGLGGVAAIVAQSGMTNESPMAWMMMLNQLGRTLRAMSAAHVARGEAEMATVLVECLEGELAALHDRFASRWVDELVPDGQGVRALDGSQEMEALDSLTGLDDELDLDQDAGLDFER